MCPEINEHISYFLNKIKIIFCNNIIQKYILLTSQVMSKISYQPVHFNHPLDQLSNPNAQIFKNAPSNNLNPNIYLHPKSEDQISSLNDRKVVLLYERNGVKSPTKLKIKRLLTLTNTK